MASLVLWASELRKVVGGRWLAKRGRTWPRRLFGNVQTKLLFKGTLVSS
jgi:hypothetical protein